MRKIMVREAPAFAKPKGNAPPTRIVATLVDGSSVTVEIDDMTGFPGRPMARAEIDRKFRAKVGKRWPRARTDAILDALWSPESTPDLSALLQSMSL